MGHDKLVTFTDWHYLEPNNGDNIQQYCINTGTRFWVENGQAYMWDDDFCENNSNFVCEEESSKLYQICGVHSMTFNKILLHSFGLSILASSYHS